MQQRIIGWMQTLGIRAINTYSETLARSEIWTCGMTRRDKDRSQIDYVGISEFLEGHGGPINFLDLQGESPLRRKMEHRP
eukprot:12412261-Karenia_brevis.AAC.1